MEIRDPRPAPAEPGPQPNGLREALLAVPVISRAAWFGLGAVVATLTTLLVTAAPWSRPRAEEPTLPFEGFPFADNSGVCQEYVALAGARMSYATARAQAARLAPLLPSPLRADNVRVVRAFAPGDAWTVAVDAQIGAGDLAHAASVAAAVNTVAGGALRFEPVFYSSRRLYDTARVLCMPRQGVATR